MRQSLVAYGVTLVSMLAIDAVWLTLMTDLVSTRRSLPHASETTNPRRIRRASQGLSSSGNSDISPRLSNPAVWAVQLGQAPVAASATAWPRPGRDTCNSRNASASYCP